MFSIGGRLWRAAGQGIAFVFVGGGFLAVIVFPAIALFTPSQDLTHRRVRYVIHKVFGLFVWFIKAMGLFDVNLVGVEKLGVCRGCLIVANHPTLLDVVIVMALYPNIQCVVKHQLWQNFFLRGVVSAAGFIRNDLGAEEVLDLCSKTFEAGDNLLIFPEGTRTVPGAYPKLSRGFANVAILSKANIQIVLIRCRPITLTQDKPWYSVPEIKPRLEVYVGDLLSNESYQQTPHRALNARRLVENLETYYRDALSHG